MSVPLNYWLPPVIVGRFILVLVAVCLIKEHLPWFLLTRQNRRRARQQSSSPNRAPPPLENVRVMRGLDIDYPPPGFDFGQRQAPPPGGPAIPLGPYPSASRMAPPPPSRPRPVENDARVPGHTSQPVSRASHGFHRPRAFASAMDPRSSELPTHDGSESPQPLLRSSRTSQEHRSTQVGSGANRYRQYQERRAGLNALQRTTTPPETDVLREGMTLSEALQMTPTRADAESDSSSTSTVRPVRTSRL